MSPSFNNNNIILLKKVNQNTKIYRGDIVVINQIFKQDFPQLKRIIGLPNEIIKIEHNGEVYVNDKLLKENYIGTHGKSSFYWELGENEYIVLGDNRKYSSDSRKFGKIVFSNLFWKAFFSLKPLKKIKKPNYL